MHCKCKPFFNHCKLYLSDNKLYTQRSEADETAARLLVYIREESSTNCVFILSNLYIHRYCDSFCALCEYDYH